MNELNEQAFYEGVSVDLVFRAERPRFGDLFPICGYENPNFPPTGRFDFASLEDLQFSQVDDYFGVEDTSDEGDDVAVWLYPLVNQQQVHHHSGPFDGLRLEYCPLRNPSQRAEHYLSTISRLVSVLPVNVIYRTRSIELPPDEALEQVRADIETIENHWVEQGIAPGSSDALRIDF